MRTAWATLLLAACACGADRAVLMISIDGLRPASTADPQLKLPNLKRLVAEGVSAEVRGVLPSVTYSSHTTLVTGVYPARHGIFSNRPFEILHKNLDAWFWYSQDIRMPTLWDVAARAGYIVGSVSWPVTVGSTSIRYNLPEFAGTRTSEDIKMIRALAGQAWFDEIARKAGPYLTDVNQAIPRDQARTRYAAELIRQRHTRFLTVHLAALDHAQHEHGPASDEANRALEAIDAMTGQLRDAMRAEDARAAICVVSDHGFAPVERALKLEAAFVREGFIKLRAERESLFLSGVAEWQAMPWPAGGSAAIVLREPGNQAARTKVREFLTKLASDPANGIAGILEEAEIARFGGAPSVAFWVDMRPGFGLSGSLAGPLTAATPGKGAHGYSPSHPEMRAFFALEGAGIPGGARLGEIDMRSIAPTVAGLLGAAMPSAELPALRLGK